MTSPTNRIKFVVVQSEVLTQRWESYLHLDELAKTFDVEFWNCSAITLPHYISKEIQRPYTKTIVSKAQYEAELQRLPQDTLIVLNRIMFNKENLGFLKTLAKRFPKQLDIDFFASNQLMSSLWSVSVSKVESTSIDKEPPRENTQKAKSISLFKSIKRWLYKNDAIQMTMKRIRYWNDKNTFRDIERNFYFFKCENMFQSYRISSLEGTKYPINPPDYEQYLMLGECKKKNGNIVFIDQAFPVHPEFRSSYSYLDIQKLAQEYYQSLRLFFDNVEKETGLKVIIAGHPVANYKGDEYGNREIVYGKTAELVRDANAVLAHTSGAVNFPIFYKKPIVFLTNSAWNKAIRHNNHLHKVASFFKKPIVDADKVDEITPYLQPVDPAIRREYIDAMVDKRTEGKFNADLLKKYFVQIHDEMYK